MNIFYGFEGEKVIVNVSILYKTPPSEYTKKHYFPKILNLILKTVTTVTTYMKPQFLTLCTLLYTNKHIF